MPYHWWLIDPDNPGPRQRAKAVRKAVSECDGAELVFVGRTKKNTWFALVQIDDPANEDDVYKAVGGRGKLFDLDGFEPGDRDRKE